jgi:hypothetical protein
MRISKSINGTMQDYSACSKDTKLQNASEKYGMKSEILIKSLSPEER